MARVTAVPLRAGEAPFLEVLGDAHTPAVEVDGRGGTTHVKVAGAWGGHDPRWWDGPWWDASWWDKRFWKKAFRVNVVAHVPADVRGRLRSTAAKMHVEGLAGCDLEISTEAGALSLDDVSGALRLRTQAGRIDARNISGSIDIETVAGAVFADVASLAPGKHRVRTNVGSVRVELARGIPVRITARTTMGATRIDYPNTEDAAAQLDLEADLGAIRVVGSGRAHPEAPAAGSPYRTAAAVPTRESNDAEVERILQRVAEGSITPEAARDLLRALGVA